MPDAPAEIQILGKKYGGGIGDAPTVQKFGDDRTAYG